MKYLIIALSMYLPSVVSAQSVEGTVFDEKGSPVEFANVVAFTLPDTTFLSGTMTDSLGHFSVETQGKNSYCGCPALVTKHSHPMQLRG